APLAIRLGRPSPTGAAHVRQGRGAAVDLILEGGASELGIESTIVDLSAGVPALLRPGAISMSQLKEVLHALDEKGRSATRHAGGMERQYAPRTPARLVSGFDLDKAHSRSRNRVAVLAFSCPHDPIDYWLRLSR